MDQFSSQPKSFSVAGVLYRSELVKCGRRSCTRCPHGPYWYAYSRSGARLRKWYVGKYLPDAVFRALTKPPRADTTDSL